MKKKSKSTWNEKVLAARVSAQEEVITKLRERSAELSRLVAAFGEQGALRTLLARAEAVAENLEESAEELEENVTRALQERDQPPGWIAHFDDLLQRLDATFTADLDLVRRKYVVCERLLWQHGINPIPHYHEDDARWLQRVKKIR